MDLNAATNAVQTVSKTADSLGPASGLSGIVGTVGGFFSSLGSFFQALDVKLPLPNPLHNYASYSYVIALGCLSDEEANDPANTYMSGGKIDLLCKSANADPDNRVNTAYGKFDFFIEDLVIEHQVGFEDGENTNTMDFSFKVIEPLSMGLFMMAAQQLAQQKGHDNWRDATWTLTIDFRGNTESGLIQQVPKSFRVLPLTLTDMDMTVTEKGTVYKIKGFPASQRALTDAVSNFKNDIAVAGASVQQVLQTGPKSLQVALNRYAKAQSEAKPGLVPDQYLIIFPNDWSSSASSLSNASSTDGGATQDLTQSQEGDLFKKLGVVQSTSPNTEGNYVQNSEDCNVIGQAILQFDDTKPGDPPSGKEQKVYDTATGVFFKGKLTSDPKESDFRFKQDDDIPNAINQVLLKSQFVSDTFEPGNLSKEGYRKWWRIDCQTFNITTNANMTITGDKPKLYVYRVIPYDVHASKMIAVNTRGPGIDELGNQCVKEYNYIYTGKNQDILDFQIYFENGFAINMEADFLERNADGVTKAQTGDREQKRNNSIDPLGTGNPPDSRLGVIPTIVKFIKTLTGTDKRGGGGPDNSSTRAARLFHDALTNNQSSMMSLNMKIMGDPYYIANSGIGNYTANESQFPNLHTDGSINYQNGEVHIKINFRTPIDLNQTTGLYAFSSISNSAPVIGWSGIYQLVNLESRFEKGQFTQILKGNRIPSQESQYEATPEGTYNDKNPAPVETLPSEEPEE